MTTSTMGFTAKTTRAGATNMLLFETEDGFALAHAALNGGRQSAARCGRCGRFKSDNSPVDREVLGQRGDAGAVQIEVTADPEVVGHYAKPRLLIVDEPAGAITERGKILLGCRRRGDKLRIEVWDTGTGIPEGQLRAIFAEFPRAASWTLQRDE